MEPKKNRTLFWVVTGLIVALMIIFIAQNHQSVRIQFLIINITGPGFLVFLVVFFLGFLGGWGWENSRKTRRGNREYIENQEVHKRQ